MHATLTILAVTLITLLPVINTEAAIYTYKDEQGRTVFVDEEYKIPAKFRGKTAVITEQSDLVVPAEEAGAEEKPAEPPAQTLVDRETQMRARQQVELLDRERAYQTPVMVRGNRVLVPVEVGVGNSTSHLMLLLDTGTANTVLYRPSVKDLPFAPGKQVSIPDAGGRPIKSEQVVTRFIDIGPFELKDFPVMLINPQAASLPYDGKLGFDFLQAHPYEIDFTNEILRWKPATP